MKGWSNAPNTIMKRMISAVLMLALVASFALIPAMAETAPGTEWTIENAAEVFVNDVIIPENAAQYKKELTIQLTEEQAENFQEGLAVIYVPNVFAQSETAIQAICYLPVELTEDLQLKADFSGLYVTVDEDLSESLQAQLVTIRPILMSRQESMDDGKAVLALKGVFYGELEALYSPFTISIDYAANTAQIDSITVNEPGRGPLNGYYSAFRYTYLMDESAELPHFLDMASTAWTLWYEKKIEGPRTIRLRPVSGTGCKVLFSVTNKDGSKYSLAPVNYD